MSQCLIPGGAAGFGVVATAPCGDSPHHVEEGELIKWEFLLLLPPIQIEPLKKLHRIYLHSFYDRAQTPYPSNVTPVASNGGVYTGLPFIPLLDGGTRMW